MIDPNPAPREASLEVARRLMGTCTGTRIDSSPLVQTDLPKVEYLASQKGTGDLLASLGTVLNVLTPLQETAPHGFRKQFDHSMPYLIAALHEGAFPSANFDYNSNPAAAEGESLVCEMVRKLVGLHEHYSLKSNGLGKIAVTFNEVLLLCYHSTVYVHPQEVEAKLVLYTTAQDAGELQKVLSIRNCQHWRKVTTSQTDPVQSNLLERLKESIEADVDAKLIPHFFHYQIQRLSELNSEHLKKLQELTQKHKIKVLLDATNLGVQVLRELSFQHADADFVAIDLAQLGGPSSNIFFLKERFSFREKLVNVPMEYLKTYSDLVTNTTKTASLDSKRVCDVEFTAHDYNIGFGNFVPWERLLLVLRSLGKKGIRMALETHSKNLNSMNSLLKHQIWTKDSKVHPAYIEVLLEREHATRAVSLLPSLVHAELTFDEQRNLVLRCFAPCLFELTSAQLERQVHHLGQGLTQSY